MFNGQKIIHVTSWPFTALALTAAARLWFPEKYVWKNIARVPMFCFTLNSNRIELCRKEEHSEIVID